MSMKIVHNIIRVGIYEAATMDLWFILLDCGLLLYVLPMDGQDIKIEMAEFQSQIFEQIY